MAEEIRLPEEEKLPDIDITDEEFAEYINSLDDLTLLEASSLKRSVDETIRQWKLCKESLNSLSVADDADKKLSNSIAEANIFESMGVDTRDEFNTEYEKNIGRLEEIAAKLLAIIEEHKDEVDSTTYMTQQMITILKRRLGSSVEPNSEPFYDREKKTGELILKTFEYRLTGSKEIIDYLSQKIVPWLRSHRKEVSKSLREETKLLLEGCKTRAIKDLCRQFSENTIAKFMYHLRESLDDCAELVIIFTNFLAHMLKHGKNSGTDSYGKILVLDFTDMYNGIYDIPDWSIQEYLDLFYEKITETLTEEVEDRYPSKNWHVISDDCDCGLTRPMENPHDWELLKDTD